MSVSTAALSARNRGGRGAIALLPIHQNTQRAHAHKTKKPGLCLCLCLSLCFCLSLSLSLSLSRPPPPQTHLRTLCAPVQSSQFPSRFNRCSFFAICILCHRHTTHTPFPYILRYSTDSMIDQGLGVTPVRAAEGWPGRGGLDGLDWTGLAWPAWSMDRWIDGSTAICTRLLIVVLGRRLDWAGVLGCI